MDINVSERIAYFRCAKGLSVNKLANMAGISQSYLRDIELGKNSNPSIEVLDCICCTLGITLKDFFDVDYGKKIDDEPLIKEINLLSHAQRENLKVFLTSMRQ